MPRKTEDTSKNIEDFNDIFLGATNDKKKIIITDKSLSAHGLMFIGIKGSGKTSLLPAVFYQSEIIEVNEESGLKRKNTNAGITVFCTNKNNLVYFLYCMSKRYGRKKINIIKPSIDYRALITLYENEYSYDRINEIINFESAISNKEINIIDVETDQYGTLAVQAAGYLLVQLQTAMHRTAATKKKRHYLIIDDAERFTPYLEEILTYGDTYNISTILMFRSRQSYKGYEDIIESNIHNLVLMPDISFDDAKYYSDLFGITSANLINNPNRQAMYSIADSYGIRERGFMNLNYNYLPADELQKISDESSRQRRKMVREGKEELVMMKILREQAKEILSGGKTISFSANEAIGEALTENAKDAAPEGKTVIDAVEDALSSPGRGLSAVFSGIDMSLFENPYASKKSSQETPKNNPVKPEKQAENTSKTPATDKQSSPANNQKNNRQNGSQPGSNPQKKRDQNGKKNGGNQNYQPNQKKKNPMDNLKQNRHKPENSNGKNRHDHGNFTSKNDDLARRMNFDFSPRNAGSVDEIDEVEEAKNNLTHDNPSQPKTDLAEVFKNDPKPDNPPKEPDENTEDAPILRNDQVRAILQENNKDKPETDTTETVSEEEHSDGYTDEEIREEISNGFDMESLIDNSVEDEEGPLFEAEPDKPQDEEPDDIPEENIIEEDPSENTLENIEATPEFAPEETDEDNRGEGDEEPDEIPEEAFEKEESKDTVIKATPEEKSEEKINEDLAEISSSEQGIENTEDLEDISDENEDPLDDDDVFDLDFDEDVPEVTETKPKKIKSEGLLDDIIINLDGEDQEEDSILSFGHDTFENVTRRFFGKPIIVRNKLDEKVAQNKFRKK